MTLKLDKAFAWIIAGAALAALQLPACSVNVPDSATGGMGGVGSSGSTNAKGGGKKGSAAASSGQQGGAHAKSDSGTAQNQGTEVDGVVCDATFEGVGWCWDEASVVFCASGSWWLLDCSALADGGFCGYDDAENVVDCYGGEGVGVGAGGADGSGGGFGGRDPECSGGGDECFDDFECCSGYCDLDAGVCS